MPKNEKACLKKGMPKIRHVHKKPHLRKGTPKIRHTTKKARQKWHATKKAYMHAGHAGTQRRQAHRARKAACSGMSSITTFHPLYLSIILVR